ncbi:MAG: aldo/keto reductase, partial [Ectothiorhodospiraceae bacterium]|nr:aldo/keto reductase [Ectothiorhodospiraceae bacterium]
MDRRSFIGAGLAAGAAALGAGSHDVAAASPGVRAYRRLGRTGIEMSDISFGSSSSADPALVRHALDRGVNYFDSAESYRWGSAEEAIGQALVGVRDRVHLTSKTKAGAHDGWRDIMAALEGSLRRLRTDYVDVYFNHAVNDLERIRNPEWGEFTERAKAAGK